MSVFESPVGAEETEIALTIAESRIGQDYDLSLILSLAIALIKGHRCHGDIRDTDMAWICSELVAKPLMDVANFVFIDAGLDMSMTTPADIYNKLSELATG